MTATRSEIMKAAHRQARRMEFLGGPSYAQRLGVAMRQMYAAARKPGLVQLGYDASLCHTLSRSQRDQITA